MSLTFPRDLPSLKIRRCNFELDRGGDAITAEQKGRVVSVQLADPLWRMTLQTEISNEADWGRWTAFVDSLQGARHSFYGFDIHRKRPRLYPRGFIDATTQEPLTRAAGGTFDGDALTWSVSSSREVLMLTGLPAALRLTERDYIGFRWGTNRRALVRVLNESNTTAEGVGSWSIAPVLPRIIPAEATATLLNPACTMKMLPGTAQPEREGKAWAIRFEAIQHLID
jgi:hypothetical protein